MYNMPEAEREAYRLLPPPLPGPAGLQQEEKPSGGSPAADPELWPRRGLGLLGPLLGGIQPHDPPPVERLGDTCDSASLSSRLRCFFLLFSSFLLQEKQNTVSQYGGF
ncbi:unnamed protein product [Arctogadus glacialis]